FPGRLPADIPHQIAGQPIVMHTDSLELAGTLFEKLGLTCLAAVGLENHQFEPALAGFGDDCQYRRSGLRFEKLQVVNNGRAVEPRVLANDILIKVSHDSPSTWRYFDR